MPESVITKTIAEFYGKNSRDNDISRPPIFCRDALNVDSTQRGGVQWRRGYKGIALGAGGGGLATYLRTSAESRTLIEELVTIDSELWVLREGAFHVSYTGSELNRTFQLLPQKNPDGTYSFHCKIWEGGVAVLDVDLGTGVNELSPVSINSLISDIDGLARFTCSLNSGPGTGPAALIPNTEGMLIAASPGFTAVKFKYWEKVFCPITTPFAAFWADVNTSTFQNASMENCDDQLFIATGKNELYVYDSHAVYRAGMPAATALAAETPTTGGNLTLTGTYEWFITYEFLNAVDRVIEGSESNRVRVTLTGSNNLVPIILPYIQDAAGFYTRHAIISSGSGSGTTIPVNSGHTLRAGDNVVVTNPSTGQGQETKVISTSSTQVVLRDSVSWQASSTGMPTGVISTVRVNVWRNAAGDTELKYLIYQFGNNGATTNVVCNDGKADSVIIGYANYMAPVKNHDLPPPNLKYLTVFNTLLCGVTGVDEEVWFSDWDGPHYFPADSSSFNLRSKTASLISGIGATKEMLCVFKGKEVHLVIGDLPNANFRQELIASAIGCDSHHTIFPLEGRLCFWSRTYGLRAVSSSISIDDLSYRILPDWTAVPESDRKAIVEKHACAIVDASNQRILLYVPREINNFHNAYSRLYVGYYKNQNIVGPDGHPLITWWLYGDINMQGGAVIYNNIPYFIERRRNLRSQTSESILSAFLYDNIAADFCDHAQPYEVVFDGAWYCFDEPSILKKWTDAKLYSLEDPLTSKASFVFSLDRMFQNGSPVVQKQFQSGISLSACGWGMLGWGVFSWGDYVIKSYKIDLGVIVSAAIKPVIRAEAAWCEHYIINGVEFRLVPDYDRQIQE